MNKRIKTLIEQADIKFEAHPQHQGIDTAVVIQSDLAKFAELIVRECANAVENSVWHLPRGYKAVDQAEFVKKHFGVDK